MAVILVTGANGFVGQALCKYWHEQGHHLVRPVVRRAGPGPVAGGAAPVLMDIRADSDWLARLAGLEIEVCTGAGTGLDAPAVQRKTEVLREVLARHPDAQAPLEALAAFGGFEIATMVGAVLQAAHERRVVVVDGFIATSAVLVATHLQPHVLQRCVFAHRSGERGHALMLAHLKAEPLLDLGLRLGEGSGAALAWPLLVSACALLREMASFEAAGVSRSDEAAPVRA